MSRLRVSFTLIDNLDSSTRSNEERLSSTFSRIGGIETQASKVGGMLPTLIRHGGMSCYLWRIDILPEAPYLEIEPTVVWVLNGWTSNEVYSNTTWDIQ